MAFNPFNFFRKYQKVIFGILAIICMLVFVLQFGAGDPFGRAMSWFGKRHQGQPIATVYGQSVYEEDLGPILRHRQIATEFLWDLFFDKFARVAAEEPTRFGPPRFGPAGGQVIEKLPGTIGERANKVLANCRARGDQLSQLTQGFPPDPATRQKSEAEARRDLDLLRGTMVFTRAGAENKPDILALDTAQRGALDDLLLYLQYELYLFGQGSNFLDMRFGMFRSTNKTFFLGGGKTPDELLDFLVWKNHPSARNLVLTDMAVMRMAYTYTGHKSIQLPEPFSFAKDRYVSSFVGGRPRDRNPVTAPELLEALRDEFLYALTRENLAGRPAPGTFPALALNLLPTTPSQTSTAEGFEVFRRLTTTQKVPLLEIPVQDFLAKVEEKKLAPTEKDLQELFAKYKDDEPNPDRSRPGFKEPRRVKVQYIHISGESPYIREQAERTRSLLLGLSDKHPLIPLTAYAESGTMGMMGPIAAAMRAAVPRATAEQAHLYELYKQSPTCTLDGWINRKNPIGDPYPPRDTSWVREGPLRVLIPQLAASMHTQGSPLGALLAFRGEVDAFEEGDQNWQTRKLLPAIINGEISKAMSAHLSNAGLGAGFLNAAYPVVTTAVLQHKSELLEPLSQKVIGPTLNYVHQKAILDELTISARATLLREAYEEIRKQHNKPEAEAAPVLEKYFKEKNLTPFVHTTPYAEDVYELRKEPAMNDLATVASRAVELGRPRLPESGADRAVGMAIQSRGTYDPWRWSPDLMFRLAMDRELPFRARMRLQEKKLPMDKIQEVTLDLAQELCLADPDAVLVWRSEDKNSFVPGSLNDFVASKDKSVKVREKVLAAWKFQNAQRLAQEFALELRDKIRKDKVNQPVWESIRWLSDQKPGTNKVLDNVGRLVRVPSASPTDPRFQPGTIPAYVVEQPRPDMIETLMTNLKEVGDSVVVSDLPVKHWYVGISEIRREESMDTYLSASKTDDLAAHFYTQYTLPGLEKTFEENLIKRLRADAGKDSLDALGRWRIPPNIKTNFERPDTE
jgi:hypothetical protein